MSAGLQLDAEPRVQALGEVFLAPHQNGAHPLWAALVWLNAASLVPSRGERQPNFAPLGLAVAGVVLCTLGPKQLLAWQT